MAAEDIIKELADIEEKVRGLVAYASKQGEHNKTLKEEGEKLEERNTEFEAIFANAVGASADELSSKRELLANASNRLALLCGDLKIKKDTLACLKKDITASSEYAATLAVENDARDKAKSSAAHVLGKMLSDKSKMAIEIREDRQKKRELNREIKPLEDKVTALLASQKHLLEEVGKVNREKSDELSILLADNRTIGRDMQSNRKESRADKEIAKDLKEKAELILNAAKKRKEEAEKLLSEAVAVKKKNDSVIEANSEKDNEIKYAWIRLRKAAEKAKVDEALLKG